MADEFGVEVAASVFFNKIDGFLNRSGFLVGSFGCQGVENSAERGDASLDRNFLALQTLRVSTAVPFFMIFITSSKQAALVRFP